MKKLTLLIILFSQSTSFSQYAPGVGEMGTTAIKLDSSIIINWANSILDFDRGYIDIAIGSNTTTIGLEGDALGVAQVGGPVVSLGDNGIITLGFEHPIKNGLGPDFAVFENSFSDTFLELAHIEVSTNGIDFIRIPSVSLTQTAAQIDPFGALDATKLHNLAGKYKAGYGTPFDLEDIIDSTGVNLDSINYVRVIDVIGTLNTTYATYDSQGNIINDPYPTAFSSGGFDLDAIAVINENTFVGLVEKKSSIYHIYPNPSNEIVTIYAETKCEVDIISINGQLIHHYSLLKNEKIKVNDLKSGLYLVYFKNNKTTFINKLVVNQ